MTAIITSDWRWSGFKFKRYHNVIFEIHLGFVKITIAPVLEEFLLYSIQETKPVTPDILAKAIAYEVKRGGKGLGRL